MGKKGKIFDLGAGMQKYGSPYSLQLTCKQFHQEKFNKLRGKALTT